MPERRLPFLILLASLLLTAYSASALTCNVLPFGATNGTVSWNAARVNTYGAVAGFPALSLSSSPLTAEHLAWRGKWRDMTSLYYWGARPYDSESRTFLSADPYGHAADASLYSAFNGNPTTFFDPDGRFGKPALASAMVPTSMRLALGMANQGIADYKMGGGGVMGSLTAVNRYNPATPFYSLAGQRDILSGKDFTWWGDYSENIGQAGLTVLSGGIMGKTLLAGQADRIASRVGSFAPGEMMPNGQIAGVGPGAMSSIELIPGRAGSFAELKRLSVVGDNLTPHHMPQAALNFTSRGEGGAIMLPQAQHVLTRTYGFSGAQLSQSEANLGFRTVLARDIRDLRGISGSEYNQGIRDMLEYYRIYFPELIAKPLPVSP